MKKFLTKRNIYIGLFAILYITVALVSLIHSFAFFGLANDNAMSIMLGTTFEIGQAAVLLSILTSKKDRSRIMPWCLMILLTAVQVLGNVYSSYKYLMTHSTGDLRFFKEPIFIWTTLPDAQATVIITYIVGAILPIVALCMTSMVSNYIEDTSNEDIEDTSNENIDDNNKLEKHPTEVPKDYNDIEVPAEEPTKETIEGSNEPIEETEEPIEKPIEEPIEESKEPIEKPIEETEEPIEESIEEVEEPTVEPIKATPKSKFLNL